MYIQACFASGNTAKGIVGNQKNSKDALLLRGLIKDALPLIEEDEEEEKIALAPGGFELVTSRLRGRCSNHFAKTTAWPCHVEQVHFRSMKLRS